jgi:hypothetical protein
MRTIALALAGFALFAAGSAIQAKPRLTSEEQLAKLIEGREAGKPVSCISQWDTRDMQVLDKTAIVYGRGNTIWVNRPANAEQLDDDDILVTKVHGAQFCRLDIVHTVDRTGHFTTGFVSLGEFVPYRRVPKVARAD